MQGLICILLALSLLFPASDATVSCSKTITVAQSGSGGFTTIQAAVNAVPSNGTKWTCIHVKAGTYKEQVTIPLSKPFIFLQGEGAKLTRVIASGSVSIEKSGTFIANADNLIVQKMTFMNTYNYHANSEEVKQAPAAVLSGDKHAFYQTAFYGVQDTLWDNHGRHYFESCTIVGSVDFIFGAGQSFYQTCSIILSDKGIPNGSLGYFTAQGRMSANDANGFVFKDCTISGTGNRKAYLGRAWKPYARVVFYHTKMANVIAPVGWDAWHGISNVNLLTFEEIGCKGAGANRSMRPNWTNKHDSDVQKMLSISYIGGSSWLISP